MALDAIAIIPARLASTRLPNKPLVDLGGAPLIVRVCENVTAAGVFQRVIVACDSEAVADVVRGAGFDASLTNPDLPSGTDRIAAVAKTLALDPETVVVNVQGDEPFVDAAALRGLVAAFRQNPLLIPGGSGGIATVIERCLNDSAVQDPNVVKVAVGEQGRALYFSRAPIPFARDREDREFEARYYRHVGLYAFRAKTLQDVAALSEHPLERQERLEQLRWLAHGFSISCIKVEPGARGIDTTQDLELARTEFARRRSG